MSEKDKIELTVENEETVEVPEKCRLDHLNDVLDAQIAGNSEAATSSFHNYLTMSTQDLIAKPDVDVADVDIADIAASLEDDVDVSDINIADHIPTDKDE